jgi:outer membrane protein assembly factor BamB
MRNSPVSPRSFPFSGRIALFQGFLLVFLTTAPIPSGALPFDGRTPGNKLTASDAQDGDQFATSVAASEEFIAVGAIFEDGEGISSDNFGSVYVYDATTGEELMKLQASDPGAGDRFGHAVAISGNLLVVGALFEDGSGISSDNFGAAYVFDLTTGEELFKLQAASPGIGDRFGEAVGISGRHVVVGSQYQDWGGVSNAQRGAAYFFDLDDPVVPNPIFPKELRENEKFGSSDLQDGDQFGHSVAVSGGLAIVGALNEDGTGSIAAQRGAAYVFRLPSCEQWRKLTPTDPADGDRFGKSVAIENDLVLVGADSEDGSGSDRGAAYLFSLNSGNQIHQFRSSDTEDGDEFGTSVALSSGIALAGAPLENGEGAQDCQRGAFYAFDAVTGAELEKFVASDTADGDQLGFSVALAGRVAVAGAHLENGEGSNRGAAYVYHTPLYQPDVRIGRHPSGGMGDGLYNTTGAGQTLSLISRKLKRGNVWVAIENDGDRDDGCVITGSPGDRFFAVSYFQRAGSFRSNVSAAVIAGVHEEPSVLPGEAARSLSMEMTPLRKLKKTKKGRSFILRKTYRGGVTAVSGTLSHRSDRVGVVVQAR